ncbi:hypothetical protein P8605_27720 [Streptomyces sp. T-3]|nr:hypothetical protein [Streptomyces sp. T-3]
MSLTVQSRALMRPATEVNAEIRALWASNDGRLSPEQRTVYLRLVTEWAAAVRSEVVVTAA